MGSSTKKAQSVFNIISMNSPEMYFALGAFLFGAVSALQTRSTVVIQEMMSSLSLDFFAGSKLFMFDNVTETTEIISCMVMK